eukprot:gene3581-7120_t
MPLHFIRDTIKPFYVQAREAGIEIVYSSETELKHLEESSSTNVCMNDILRLEIIDMGAGISP